MTLLAESVEVEFGVKILSAATHRRLVSDLRRCLELLNDACALERRLSLLRAGVRIEPPIDVGDDAGELLPKRGHGGDLLGELRPSEPCIVPDTTGLVTTSTN